MRHLIFTLFVVLLAGGCRKAGPFVTYTYNGSAYLDCDKTTLGTYYITEENPITPNTNYTDFSVEYSNTEWEYLTGNFLDEEFPEPINLIFADSPWTPASTEPVFIISEIPIDVITASIEMEVYPKYEIDVYVQYAPENGLDQDNGFTVTYNDYKADSTYSKAILGPIAPGEIIDTISAFWLNRVYYPDLDIYTGTIFIGDHSDPNLATYEQHEIQMEVCDADSLVYVIK